MGRDLGRDVFARIGAVLSLAAAIFIGLFLLAAVGAKAAPADRASDPVVLTGKDVPAKLRIAPAKILAYKWTGRWRQIPVQIDERHTVDARSLYPPESKGYLNLPVGTFDVEVYADPKTRSGADDNVRFDADDELVFMAGDSGQQAPASALAPKGVDPASATRIQVTDPAGGAAWVYLFKTTARKADQSAGKDYVSYDFKLTRLGPGETLIDDYGYQDSNNPEDSTIKTASYELHSTDRWNEDEIRITAGGAPGHDILDREAVSAGNLGGCGRSEYTFSGNWERGSDTDEGTYLVIKDGPVRALRAYMGANSGPYVEDVHVYYADREDRNVKVRVHPIPYMYVWTDLNETAIGMVYRDEKNPEGMTIDGEPESPVPPDPEDLEDGNYVWQQVAGNKGSFTTMVAARTAGLTESDRTFFDFAGYYLDDSTPSNVSADKERQCGGDMKAYGASGFGIDGTYPNTDPRLALPANPARDLSVDRIRYFSGPGASAAEAETLRARAQHPLIGTATSTRVRARSVKLKVRRQGAKPKAIPGKRVKLRLKVRNTGTADAKKGKVCVTGKAIVNACKPLPALAAGKSKRVTVDPKVKRKARGKLKVRIRASAGGKNAGMNLTLALAR